MKTERRKKIISYIENYDIETQEEICELLKKDGYDVTQATVSRDIRKLNLTKIVGRDGRQRYAVLRSEDEEDSNEKKNRRILIEAVKSVDTAGNLLVIKTSAGMAPAVGAVIDSMNIPAVVGCIAGDDTIMCAMKKPEDSEEVMEKINNLIKTPRKDAGIYLQ